jgi:hypothetical protein
MSSGRYCLIRDLGLVKGGRGLRHHEVVLEVTWRGLIRFAMSTIRTNRTKRVAEDNPDVIRSVPDADRASGQGATPAGLPLQARRRLPRSTAGTSALRADRKI